MKDIFKKLIIGSRTNNADATFNQKSQPFTRYFIKIQGEQIKPFKDFDFDNYDVFEMEIRNDMLVEPKRQLDLFNEVMNFHQFFEIWHIPLEENPKLMMAMWANSNDKHKDNPKLKEFLNNATQTVPKIIKVNKVYIITKKDVSVQVCEHLEKFSAILTRKLKEEVEGIIV